MTYIGQVVAIGHKPAVYLGSVYHPEKGEFCQLYWIDGKIVPQHTMKSVSTLVDVRFNTAELGTFLRETGIRELLGVLDPHMHKAKLNKAISNAEAGLLSGDLRERFG